MRISKTTLLIPKRNNNIDQVFHSMHDLAVFSDYRSSHQGADDTQQQVQETRCRVPPGFEKTVLETTVGAAPPPAHQQQRAVHMPAAHTWQVKGSQILTLQRRC